MENDNKVTEKVNGFKESNEIGKVIYTKLKELKLESKININLDLDFNDEEENKYFVSISGSVDDTRKDDFETLKSFCDDINKQNGQEVVQFDAKLIFKFIRKIENIVNFNNESVVFEHTKGEVLLVDFWATWCGPCQRPMQHNQDMLTKNAEKWKGKVRIVGVGLQDDLDSFKNRVTEKNWTAIEHYVDEKGANFGVFDFNGIPYVLLVDKNGEIKYDGHPSSVDLEQTINDLIEDKEVNLKNSENNEGEVKVEITFEERNSYKEIMNNFKEINKESLSIFGPFIIKNIFSKKFTEENWDKEVGNLSIIVFGKHTGTNKEKVTKILLDLDKLEEEKFKQKGILDKRLLFKQFHSVDKLEDNCTKCKQAIKDEAARYFCYDCYNENKKDYTYCVSCIPEEDSFENQFHQHLLVYVPKNDKEILSNLYNLRESTGVENKRKEMPYYCDNCSNGVTEIDYTCVICHISVRTCFDYCKDCFILSQKPEDPEFNIKIKKHSEHDTLTHPIARVPYYFNTNYRNFETVKIEK